MGNFIHLHNHSEYSLLDGFARIKRMAQKAADNGMSAVAITDHGVMYGAVEFYNACNAVGVKPIIGCEVYVAANSRFDQDPVRDKERFHLVLLAENQTGYQNLCKLVSRASTEGFYYKPRVDHELLTQYHEGIIALSACLSGEVPRALLRDDPERARAAAQFYIDTFGRGNYFIEIQNQGLSMQPALNKKLAALARELDVPLVATNDVHFIDRDDYEYHNILLCLQTGKTIAEENPMRFETDQFYFKTEQEMAEAFPEYPEALSNTQLIADRCHVEFDFSHHHLPVFEVPEGYDLESYLRKLCDEGLERRYPAFTDEVRERYEYEFGIIKKMGFLGYFLIVWDMINFARESGIAVGPGRGSAAGSIVAYALGITDIDPLKYKLLFERFLNPERISMPDIDTDFCYERRGEVFDYLARRYGADHVAQIITFGTMKAKLAVRDVGRVLDMSYGEVDKVAKLVPDDLGMTIEKALKQNPDLRGLYEHDDRIRQLLDSAMRIEGMPRHHGLHAAGLVITPHVISDYVPVQRTDDGGLATQYAKEIVEGIGLLKMDLLGLRTLTVIRDAITNIKAAQGIEVDISRIPLDDRLTYDMLSRGEGNSVFQLESNGMQNVMRNLHPESIEEITALVALYRPGPIEGGMIDDFVDRKHGRKEIVYDHPLLEPVLNETYGVILYQEQVMQIAGQMAGFSMAEADYLRKAMGKKKPEVLAKFKKQFIDGAVEKKVPKATAAKVFELMEKFAGYGFNKSHSVAYAVVAYQTAWLKANYPKEYLAAIMTSVTDKTDKLVDYIEECRRIQIEVLPPDINESRKDFTVVGQTIRFGLAAVKNVGEAPCRLIVGERDANGPFLSLMDFCERVNVNSRTLEGLISAGAFDRMELSRNQMLAIAGKCQTMAQNARREREQGLMNLFGEETAAASDRELFPEVATLPPLPKDEMLKMEKAALGLFLTGHILGGYTSYWADYALTPLNELHKYKDRTQLYVAGMISHIRIKANKQNQLFGQFDLEDLKGKVHCFIFAREFEENRRHLEEDAILALNVTVRRNDDEISLQGTAVTEIKTIKALDVPSKHGLLNIRKNEDVDNYRDLALELPDCPFEEEDEDDDEPLVLDIPVTTAEVEQTDFFAPEPERTVARRLYLNVREDEGAAAQDMEIKKLLARHAGPDAVYAFSKQRGTVKPYSFSVNTEGGLLAALQELLGPANVFLKTVES